MPPHETTVDVGIPTHDRPEYVVQAIESVLAQTLRAWRLRVSESSAGGGPVEAAVAPFLADPRISFEAVGDIGGPANWTRLIQAGSADYVALLHDDDLWDPEFLARRVAFLERHPECAFVFSGNREIDAAGKTVGCTAYVLPEGAFSPPVLVPLLFRHNVIGVPSILVRRTAYEAVGASFRWEHCDPFWDYEMWVRLAVRFSGGYLRVRDCSYRIHDERLTLTLRRFGAAYLHMVDVTEHLAAQRRDITLPFRLRRRRRSQALLVCGLDAIEDGSRGAGLSFLAHAIRTYPPSVVDPRFAAGLAATALGSGGRRLLGRARLAVHRRNLRPHLLP